jgi:hypothetical protein
VETHAEGYDALRQVALDIHETMQKIAEPICRRDRPESVMTTLKNLDGKCYMGKQGE